jgi:hypothetical protein
MLRQSATVLLVSLLLTACDGSNNSSNNNAATELNPYADYSSELYDGTENWLCRPDIQDENNVCMRDISATIVFADGTTQLEENPIAQGQGVDCFYVYPTVSLDETDNADLVPGREISTTFSQASRYRSVCELHAPMYRQITIAALFAGKFGDSDLANIAYGDVVDAFKRFVANAEGRGFILIGHSQGTSHLTRLIQEEVETSSYLAERMIAAHLIGIPVALPNDAEVGATFESTPPCTFDEEINCFVNYSAFRDSEPPVEGQALFGLTASADTRAACTHPVDLGAGQLNLDAYFLANDQLQPYANPAESTPIDTPFVKVPGLLVGECIERDGKGYLEITQNADPDDPRVDDVGNDFIPGWGLHLIDIPLAQGDLVRLAQKQADTWLDR